MHRHGVVHRDLKLENWLMQTPGDTTGIKLIDFGLSKHFSSDQHMQQAVGSTYYVAPGGQPSRGVFVVARVLSACVARDLVDVLRSVSCSGPFAEEGFCLKTVGYVRKACALSHERGAWTEDGDGAAAVCGFSSFFPTGSALGSPYHRPYMRIFMNALPLVRAPFFVPFRPP